MPALPSSRVHCFLGEGIEGCVGVGVRVGRGWVRVGDVGTVVTKARIVYLGKHQSFLLCRFYAKVTPVCDLVHNGLILSKNMTVCE